MFGVRLAPLLAGVVLLSAGGFAAASIASGGGLSLMGTTGTTGTLWATTGALPSKVTVCHHTHSKKKPSHTITIGSKALPAHLRHGDTLGSCFAASSASTTTTTAPGKHEGDHENQDEDKGKGQGKGHEGEGNDTSSHGDDHGQGGHGSGHKHG
jgi:hypothetical protein